jgi:predicted ATPase
VISLLNLSITDNEKAEIADPCECATGWTMRQWENAAATLNSLSLLLYNKV